MLFKSLKFGTCRGRKKMHERGELKFCQHCSSWRPDGTPAPSLRRTLVPASPSNSKCRHIFSPTKHFKKASFFFFFFSFIPSKLQLIFSIQRCACVYPCSVPSFLLSSRPCKGKGFFNQKISSAGLSPLRFPP